MSSNLEILEAEALQLPHEDRSHLLERLIASLDIDPEGEKAWAREADRGQAELQSGAVAPVSGLRPFRGSAPSLPGDLIASP